MGREGGAGSRLAQPPLAAARNGSSSSCRRSWRRRIARCRLACWRRERQRVARIAGARAVNAETRQAYGEAGRKAGKEQKCVVAVAVGAVRNTKRKRLRAGLGGTMEFIKAHYVLATSGCRERARRREGTERLTVFDRDC